ncbi:MAG TPA: CsbD family protein [Ktedonobacteraceae bacterium]
MSEYEEKDLGKQGLGDKLKGKKNEYTGKAQKQMGKMTGNREQEIKGKAREVGGAAQGKAGDVERNIDKELDR